MSHILITTQNYPIAEIDGSEVNYLETKSYDLDKIKLIPLLWQAGYLTIDSYNPQTQNYKLTYPNKEVKESFFTFFLSNLIDSEMSDITRSIDKANQAIGQASYHCQLKRSNQLNCL